VDLYWLIILQIHVALKEKYDISFCITRSHQIATVPVSVIVAKNIVSFCGWDRRTIFGVIFSMLS